MGREKCEKYPKNKRNLLLFGGGEIQNLGGGGKFPPLKALKKTLHVMFNCGILFVKIVFRCGILRFIPQVLIVE